MKSFWNWYAFFYDVLNTFGPYKTLQEKVVSALQLIPYLKIGDFGCGTGNTTRAILQKGKWNTKVIAIDGASAMITRAKKKTENDDRVRFILGNIEHVEEKEKFDRIVSVNSLYITTDPLQTLVHWHEILDEGGLAVIANPFLPKLKPIFDDFFRTMWKTKDIMSFLIFLVNIPRWIALIVANRYIARKAEGKKFHFLEPQALRTIAENVGFKVLSEELVYGNGSVLMVLQKDSDAPIRRAHTLNEIGECYRIRYNAYCEGIKSLPSENYPDKKESDAFDAYAAHFIWKEDGVVVGCIRLIPDYGSGFLLEDGGNSPIPVVLEGDRNSILEFSRMAVMPSRRGKNIGYAAAEYGARWGFERSYCTKWIAMCQERVWEGFRRNGWGVTLWGDYRNYHDTFSAPGLLVPPFLNKDLTP
jgi:ubiquinone/menaquinone biosynthesis C-methylase UbiE/N-acyl-L-homoserine lactone synthetase